MLLVGQLWAIPAVVLMRMLRPFVVIRVDFLLSEYFGHYAGNVELHLCERDLGINTPKGRHLDLWFNQTGVVSNRILERQWKRRLTILPRVLLAPIHRLNQAVPGGAPHRMEPTYHDRDVRNLLGAVEPHVAFSADEEANGERVLRAMGIPAGARFVCLNVRDATFHTQKGFTNYRNADIETYVEAAAELSRRGFYVLRMGKKVGRPFASSEPRVIDYATTEFRSDFMDLYLGAKCAFAVSTSSGWDNVPGILFRRPVLYTNMVPISQIQSWSPGALAILKRHWSDEHQRFLTQSEIFCLVDRGFVSSDPPFERRGISLVENTPAQITEAVVEMIGMVSSDPPRRSADDERRQTEFREVYERNLVRFGLRHLHGTINVRIGSRFLEDAPELCRDTIDPAFACAS